MITTTQPIGRRLTRLVPAALVATLLAVGAAQANPGSLVSPNARRPMTGGGCTMASPARRATIEAHLVAADGFCELVSHALASDVFRSAVVVTPDRYWHFVGTALSCRLRYGQTSGRVTIRNSVAACRWFTRAATGWQREPVAPA